MELREKLRRVRATGARTRTLRASIGTAERTQHKERTDGKSEERERQLERVSALVPPCDQFTACHNIKTIGARNARTKIGSLNGYGTL